MECTNQEAPLIFRRWLDERTPLMLHLSIRRDLNPLYVRGPIGNLAEGAFHIVGNSMSLSLRFEDLIFHYDEIISSESCSEKRVARVAQVTPRIPANHHEFVHEPFLYPETVLRIAEDRVMRSVDGVSYFPIPS